MSIITTYSGITEVSPEDLLIIADMSILGTPTRTVNAQMLVGGSTAPLALTTFGTSGDATLINNVLNVPNYSSGTMSSWFVGGAGGFEVTDGESVLFIGGSKINIIGNSSNSVTLAHNNTTRVDTNTAISPAAGTSFDVIDSITQDATGHPTAVNVKTVTLPTAGGGAGDTTYDLTSAQSGSNVNVNLVGSDATTDTVKFVAGTGITLTDSGSNQITVAGTEGTVTTISGGTSTFITNAVTNPTTTPVITSTLSATGTPGATTFLRGDNTWAVPAGGGGGTTYDLASAQDGANVDITLTPSTGTVDTVQLTAGTNITLTDNGSNNITIDAAGGGGGSGLWTAAGSNIYNNNHATGAVLIGRSSLTDAGVVLELGGRVSQVGSNTLFGFNAGQFTTGNNNTAFGNNALESNVSGVGNTAIGYYALEDNTANANTAVGGSAGQSTTTGMNNTAIGSAALRYNTTGNFNVAIGSGALNNITTGDNNTAIGLNAMGQNTTGGSNNTVVGFGGLVQNTTGSGNLCLGVSSMDDNTTGSSNTVVGTSGFSTNITGSFNIALGNASGGTVKNGGGFVTDANNSMYLGVSTKSAATNATNEIVIGYNAEGYGTNTVTLGNDDVEKTYLKGVVVLEGYTFATLPASPVVGMRTYITDSAFPTYYTNAAAGGTYKVPVFYDGSNWLWA